MPKSLSLFIIGFGRPDLLREQIRLLRKNLRDPFSVCLIDNTPYDRAKEMETSCREIHVGYLHAPGPTHEHDRALNFASAHAFAIGCEFWGTLDHDVFPSRETNLLARIEQCGFYGLAQRHNPTNRIYLWPGFAFFSSEWLGHRIPNFSGIRGVRKEDDGDCGSMLTSLFTEADWERFHAMEHHHGYGELRPPDDYGIQSFGYEIIEDGWIHLTNGSHWKRVPKSRERDRLAWKLIESL